MLNEMEFCLASRENFALETTLSSRTLANFIKRCKDADYNFILIYVRLQDANLAVERVARRVRAGGHDIPQKTILRRYERGLTNFFSVYKNMADQWTVLDNTQQQPAIVARMYGEQMEILEPQKWALISGDIK